MDYPRLHLDWESRSAKELSNKSSKAVGLYRYAIDETTSIWMASYRFEYAKQFYGPVKRWWRDEPFPVELIDHVAASLPVVAHHAQFERVMWNFCLPRQVPHRPVMTIEQMDCTAARCKVMGLPSDLERAAMVVNAPVQKDTTGGGTMLEMAKPRSIVFSNEAAGLAYYAGDWVECLHDGLDVSRYCIGFTGEMTITWWYDRTRRERLSLYCDDDVYAECGVDVVVPYLTPSERETWELDQRINDRGVMLDKTFIERLIAIVELAVARANRQMWTLTAGKIKKCTEHKRVAMWLAERGIRIQTPDDDDKLSVAKGATEELVALSKTQGDEIAQKVIELHNAASKSSTAKFRRALQAMMEDKRGRGMFVYHKASQTGRWASEVIQLQNLVRIDEDRDLPTIRVIVDIVMTFDTETAFDLIGVL